jgi:hypothetical protein
MIPNLLLPPEIAAARPPAWTVAGTLLVAVLLATGLTVASLPILAP